MPRKTKKTIQHQVKSTRGRKPNIPAGEWVHGYPIVILPMVSKTDSSRVMGYEVYALNMPSLGAVRTHSENIQRAFSEVNQRIKHYLGSCKKRGVKPTPPTLHGDMIPAPLSHDLQRRLWLFAEIDAEAIRESRKKSDNFRPKRGAHSKVQIDKDHVTEWSWEIFAGKVADRFNEKHSGSGLRQAHSDEVTRARRRNEYRAVVLNLVMD
jgi:hypothetical protein